MSRGEVGFDALICDEEECSARRGADYGGADAAVDAAETAGGEEAGGGLEAGFERVEGVEGGVHCGAGYASCLDLLG